MVLCEYVCLLCACVVCMSLAETEEWNEKRERERVEKEKEYPVNHASYSVDTPRYKMIYV